MDYDKLLNGLLELGAERVPEDDGPDRVEVVTGGDGEAIIITTEGERAYLVSVATWTPSGEGNSARDRVDTDDVEEAIEAVRSTYTEIMRDLAAQGVALARSDPEPEFVIPAGASQVGMVTMNVGPVKYGFDVSLHDA